MKAKDLKVGDKILINSNGTTLYHKVLEIKETIGLFGEKLLEVSSQPLKVHSEKNVFGLHHEITCIRKGKGKRKNNSPTVKSFKVKYSFFGDEYSAILFSTSLETLEKRLEKEFSLWSILEIKEIE